MKTFTLLTLAVFAALVPTIIGQEAKIMIIEKPDSQRLVRAYREFKEAQKRWEEAKSEVSKGYTFESGKPIPGWEKVQFSADFRAIVPDSSQYAYRGWNGCSGVVLTNGTGTTVSNDASILAADLGVDNTLTVKEPKRDK